ncbi:MAG: SMC-Scp complex subunit ScpB [Nitrospirota bacterium]
MEDREAKSVIEAILFMSGEPVSLDSLRKVIEIDKYNTERLVRELINDYSLKNSGLLLLEVAGGFQLVTNPACAPWVKKLLSTSVPKKLTQSSLETLAIIAYKQPIIKAEIEAIRGVNSDGVVKTLLDRRLVKLLGRKEVPGRPLMYGTTNEFLHYFGLKDLTELPTLKEFQEIEVPEPPETLPEETEIREPAEAEGEVVESHEAEEETVESHETEEEAVESHEAEEEAPVISEDDQKTDS